MAARAGNDKDAFRLILFHILTYAGVRCVRVMLHKKLTSVLSYGYGNGGHWIAAEVGAIKPAVTPLTVTEMMKK